MTCSIRLLRWQETLLAIGAARSNQCYCERLCRILHCSRTHIREIANRLAQHNLIRFESVKNVKRLILTDLGEQARKNLLALKSELNGIRPSVFLAKSK